MPIYGYECGRCGHQFEVLQRVSDEPLRTCPECSGPLRKLLYPVGVIFKGAGFYSTDYKTSKANGSSGSESSADAKPGTEGKADKKPEKKADAKPAAE